MAPDRFACYDYCYEWDECPMCPPLPGSLSIGERFSCECEFVNNFFQDYVSSDV